MQGQIKFGRTVGNGAAINISLGWIPDYVLVANVTDSDKVTEAYLGGDTQVVPFTSGGTTEVTAGAVITGATTTTARALVREVLLYSGTWAGGDAAGFFVVEMLEGTFTTEAVYISNDATTGADDASVTANVTHSIDYDAEVAAATSNAAITRYVGSSTAAKGFTIGSTVAEEAKLLCYIAVRGDQ